MADCIDLAERFGEKYRVAYEESYYAERGNLGRLPDPWLRIIPCQFGHVFPWGGDYLAASTNTRGPTATALAKLPCVEVVQDGDDGVTVRFHVDQFSAVAKIMRPKLRRVLSEAQRATLARNAYKPQAREDAPQNGQECVSTGRVA